MLNYYLKINIGLKRRHILLNIWRPHTWNIGTPYSIWNSCIVVSEIYVDLTHAVKSVDHIHNLKYLVTSRNLWKFVDVIHSVKHLLASHKIWKFCRLHKVLWNIYTSSAICETSIDPHVLLYISHNCFFMEAMTLHFTLKAFISM